MMNITELQHLYLMSLINDNLLILMKLDKNYTLVDKSNNPYQVICKRIWNI